MMFGKQGVRSKLFKIIQVFTFPFYIAYGFLPSRQSGVFFLTRLIPYFCACSVILLLELLALSESLSVALLLYGTLSFLALCVSCSTALLFHMFSYAETTNFYDVWEQCGLWIDKYFTSNLEVHVDRSIESMMEESQLSMGRKGGSLLNLPITKLDSIFNFSSDGFRFDLAHSLYLLILGDTIADVMIPVTAGPNGFSEINTCQTTTAAQHFLNRIHKDIDILIYAQTLKASLEKSNLLQTSNTKQLLEHLLRVKNVLYSFAFWDSDRLIQELMGLTSSEEGGNLFLFNLQSGYSLGNTYFKDKNQYICLFSTGVHEALQKYMKFSNELQQYKPPKCIADCLLELLIKRPRVPKAIYSDEDLRCVLESLKEVWHTLPPELKKRFGYEHEALFQLCHPRIYSGEYKGQVIDYCFILEHTQENTDDNGQTYLPIKSSVATVLRWSFREKHLKAPLDAEVSPFAAVCVQKINAIEEDVLSDVPYKALSVVLQLWIAHLNVYCVYYKITSKRVNFGGVLHMWPSLCQSLVDRMAWALSQGRNVEQDIMGWLCENAQDFEIDSAKFHIMQQEKNNTMISRFKEHYRSVREDTHVDEVLMLMPPRKGVEPVFTTHRSQIGILLSRWLTLPVSHQVNKKEKALLLKSFSEVSSGNIAHESLNFTYSSNMVLAGYWWTRMAARTAEFSRLRNFDIRNDPINKDMIGMMKMFNEHEAEVGVWLANMLKENQNVVSLVNLLFLVCQEERVTCQGRDPEVFFFFTKISSVLKCKLRDAMIANGYFSMQFRKALLMARGACPSLYPVLEAEVTEIMALPDTSTRNAFFEYSLFENGSKDVGALVQKY